MIKKIITAAGAALLFANTINAAEYPSELPENSQYFEVDITEEISNQRNSSQVHPDQYLSSNGYETQLTFLNKGGYSASLDLEYSIWEDGRFIRKYSPEKWVSVGVSLNYTIPAGAFDVVVSAARHTALFWDPIRTIVSQQMCIHNNQWTDYKKQRNIIKLDVWGTTLHPKWKFMQASGTVQNGANPAIRCGQY